MTESIIAWLIFGFAFWLGSWLSISISRRRTFGFFAISFGCFMTTLLWPLAIYERTKYPYAFWITGGGYE